VLRVITERPHERKFRILPPHFGTCARRTRRAPSARTEIQRSTVADLAVALWAHSVTFIDSKHSFALREPPSIFGAFEHHAFLLRLVMCWLTCRAQVFNLSSQTRRPANQRDRTTVASVREVLAILVVRKHQICRHRHAVSSRLRRHVWGLRRDRAPRAACPSFNVSALWWKHSARRIKQVGSWLRRAIT
jgi:hypothetical protein